ncbi:hypothetical protein ACWCPM_01030 [Streptomyces sp. NPDC002309]
MSVDRDGLGGFEHDPLMAVITDEPLTDAARADAVFLAEHRSATADVALLREQLGVLGAALAQEPDRPAEVVVPVPVRPRRRFSAFALGAAGIAAAGAMVAGLGWLFVQADGGAARNVESSADEAQSDSKADPGPLGSPEYLACARLIAEGEVTKARPVPGTGEERVTLDVTRSYKPAKGAAEVTFTIPTAAGLDEGSQVLVAIRHGRTTPDFWLVGEEAIADQRPLLTETLTRADATPCEQGE